MSTKINLCIQGNAANESEWSGTVYYCGKALEKHAEINYFNIKASRSKFKKMFWRMGQVLRGRSIYGFQYSVGELKQLNTQIKEQYIDGALISFNQLLPYDGSYKNLVYYIDCTLSELFKSDSYKIKLSESRKQELIAIEKKNYQKANKIFIMGSWLRQSLETEYGIASHKIKHVLPGANVLEPKLTENSERNCLNIGFVAKDFERKGLFYLIEIAKVLLDKGVSLKLLLVGDCPKEIADLDCVDYLGYINKKKTPKIWDTFLERCHFGALFSKEEALGISVLEFLTAGIPVMGFYHQGLKDTLIEGASLRILPNEKAQKCAEKILQFWQNRSAYENLRAEAINVSEHCNWSRAATEIMAELK